MTVEYSVTTVVNAPADEIWRLFTDLERWPEMTDSIRELRRVDSGPLRVGSEAIVRQPRIPKARWRVTEIDPGSSFAWQTTAPGVTTTGVHAVRADGQRVVITLTLRLRGPMARLTHVFAGRLAQRHLSMEMEGFRRTAESSHG